MNLDHLEEYTRLDPSGMGIGSTTWPSSAKKGASSQKILPCPLWGRSAKW